MPVTELAGSGPGRAGSIGVVGKISHHLGIQTNGVRTQNFITYPPSIILETQSELDKIISEEIKNDIRSERQVTGPDQHGVERFDC